MPGSVTIYHLLKLMQFASNVVKQRFTLTTLRDDVPYPRMHVFKTSKHGGIRTTFKPSSAMHHIHLPLSIFLLSAPVHVVSMSVVSVCVLRASSLVLCVKTAMAYSLEPILRRSLLRTLHVVVPRDPGRDFVRVEQVQGLGCQRNLNRIATRSSHRQGKRWVG